MSTSYAFGKEAEQRALRYFRSKGFTVLAQNYHYRKAEVDLIVQKENVLVAVEVKALSSIFYGDPETFVSPKQIKRLVMALDAFVMEHNLDVEVRFDIIAFTVVKKEWKMKHIEDAFYYF